MCAMEMAEEKGYKRTHDRGIYDLVEITPPLLSLM